MVKLKNVKFMSKKRWDSTPNPSEADLNVVAINGNPLTDAQITNCLLENPQLVNLTLEAGTVTLQAGSTVIVPYGTSAPTMAVGDSLNGGIISDISWDGSKLFYYVTYDTAKTGTLTYAGNRYLTVKPNGVFDYPLISTAISGTSDTTTINNHLWYDTINNVIKHYYDGTYDYQYSSFPMALITTTTEAIESIDQVFQSIGYIASTVWCGKGVKGLAPNGRNPDGSLNNIEINVTSILTRTYVDGGTGILYRSFLLASGQFGRLSGSKWHYDKTTNYNINEDDGYPYIGVSFADFYLSGTGYNIDSMSFDDTFHAVDYNDAAHLAMPSDRYIELTLGATGTSYTAPADGYIYLRKTGTASGQYLQLFSNNMGSQIRATGSAGVAGYIPIKRGNLFYVYYDLAGTDTQFRFIYAEGAK